MGALNPSLLKDDPDGMLFLCSGLGQADRVSTLLAQGADATSNGSCALLVAILNGHSACVELLIPFSEPLSSHPDALRRAARHGFDDCLRLLIAGASVAGDRVDGSNALVAAAENGHAGCVELLIPISDPLAHESLALLLAAENGHAQCVELLTPASNVVANNAQALLAAAGNGHAACVAILLERTPGLAEHIDIANLEAAASMDGHRVLAALLRATRESLSLAESSAAPAASAKPSTPRL